MMVFVVWVFIYIEMNLSFKKNPIILYYSNETQKYCHENQVKM